MNEQKRGEERRERDKKIATPWLVVVRVYVLLYSTTNYYLEILSRNSPQPAVRLSLSQHKQQPYSLL